MRFIFIACLLVFLAGCEKSAVVADKTTIWFAKIQNGECLKVNFRGHRFNSSEKVTVLKSFSCPYRPPDEDVQTSLKIAMVETEKGDIEFVETKDLIY